MAVPEPYHPRTGLSPAPSSAPSPAPRPAPAEDEKLEPL